MFLNVCRARHQGTNESRKRIGHDAISLRVCPSTSKADSQPFGASMTGVFLDFEVSPILVFGFWVDVFVP